MGFYGTEFPRVIKHNGTWHMWLAHDPTIGYATSRDGIRWTYRGEFDLPATRFNALARFLGSVVRQGEWWYAFTMEMDRNARWYSDVVRSRSPMGPWRRVVPAGPSHSRRDTEHAIVRAEGRTVVLNEPAGFVPGEPVYLLETGDPVNSTSSQLNRVVAVEGRSVALARPAVEGKTVIRTWAWDSYVTHLWRDRRGWQALGTAFHSGYPREHTLMLRSERGLVGRWTLLPMMPVWPGSWFGDEGSADWWSGENPVLVR